MKGRQLQLLVCTANLGNAQPDEDSLAAWIPKDGNCTQVLVEPVRYPIRDYYSSFDDYASFEQFDIIVIGMQEATFDPPKEDEEIQIPNGEQYRSMSASLSMRKKPKKGPSGFTKLIDKAVNLLANRDFTKQDTTTTDDWLGGTKALHSMLAKLLPSYTRTVSYQRGQMRLEVFVHTGQVDVRVVHTTGHNTGRAGLANKGGIVTELCVNGETRLAFLSAHLEAHEGPSKYAIRCSSLGDILGGTREKYHDISLSAHYSFVLGDLNFRSELDNHESLTEEEHKEIVKNYVIKRDWDSLNAADELKRALARKDCLAGFRTLFCNFPPTFKMERERGFIWIDKRRPSYTDRVLWKTGSDLATGVKPLVYEPIDNFATSDHKPIRAAFTVNLNEPIHFKTKLAQKRQGMNLGGLTPNTSHGLDVVKEHLHLFCTKVNCALDPEFCSNPDPHVTIFSYPEAVLKTKFSRWLHLKNLFSRGKSVVYEDNNNNYFQGWPTTTIKKSTNIPDWGEEEVKFEVKTYGQSGEPVNLAGAIMFFTVMDARQSGPDSVLGTYTLNLDNLIRSFPPPAPKIPKKEKGTPRRGSIIGRVGDIFRNRGQEDDADDQPSPQKPARRTSLLGLFRKQEVEEEEQSDHDDIKTIPVDAPLLRNGKEVGRIRFSMDAWWIKDSAHSAAELFPNLRKLGKFGARSLALASGRPSATSTVDHDRGPGRRRQAVEPSKPFEPEEESMDDDSGKFDVDDSATFQTKGEYGNHH